MSDFNEHNWKEALIKVYTRSLTDPDFRQLCLSDSLGALKSVSDIDFPDYFKCKFYPDKANFVYSFLLPPVPTKALTPEETAAAMIRWSTVCTLPTNGL